MKHMSGDEQMRYMNNVFNFYAMDANTNQSEKNDLTPQH